MTVTSRLVIASAAVGGLIAFGAPPLARAQSSHLVPVGYLTVASGRIEGVVRDEVGAPVAGALVSAVGGTTTFAVTDQGGGFNFPDLPPGPYLVHAHLRGYLSSGSQNLNVTPNGRVTSAIALRSAAAAPPVLTAGVGGAVASAAQPGDPAADQPGADQSDGGDTETAWRLRHARRGVLRETTGFELGQFVDAGPDAGFFVPIELLGRTMEFRGNAGGDFLGAVPFSGQVNFLTAASFNRPEELFLTDKLSTGGVAFVQVGAPIGSLGTWEVSGALNQTDISSWIVAGSYTTEEGARHRQDLGLSFSAQRYDGGHPLTRREGAGGLRNVGAVYGFDTFDVSPAITVTYGGRYARYDYLDQPGLFSPRVEMTASPAKDLRLTASLSRRAHAPGAEEFLPPGDTGIWLPPQRTFSSLERGRPFVAERQTHVAVGVEKDVNGATFGLRAFHQDVADQLVTTFGVDRPGEPAAKLGHYFVGNVGDASVSGCAAEFRVTWLERIRTSVAYTLSQARIEQADDLQYLVLVAPSALRPETERIHDISATIEAEVPETATRVLVLLRGSNGFAHAGSSRPGFDSRFDVQVRQSLPFMNFNSARLEMLVAVRNFFREAGFEQSVYDELLVVRPPTRIVGGVTLHF